MISPDARPEAPAVLTSGEVTAAVERARSFFERPARDRAQETFVFDDGLLSSPEVRTALWDACTGKCVYCETPLTERTMLVDRYRPSSGALALDGSLSPDHYWWLAYAWENMYPSCAECQSFKGARFPVRGERAPVGTTGDALRDESPLLLEPRHDDPEQHLVFAEDGSVASTTVEGSATIGILGLNRAQLVAARAEALLELRDEWAAVASSTNVATGLDPVAFDRLFNRGLPFAGLRRQFLNTWAQRRRAELDAALGSTSQGPSSVAEVAGELPVVSGAERKRVKGEFDRVQRAEDAYSLGDEVGAGEDYFRRTRRVERIEVRNFKVLGDLDIRPASVASTIASAPWLMLLGENGCGKSSVLQAVALTLMGEQERAALGLDASSYVRNGTRSGLVRVHLAGKPGADRASILARVQRVPGRRGAEADPARVRRDPAPARDRDSRRHPRRRSRASGTSSTRSARSATRPTGCSGSTTARSRRSRERSRACSGSSPTTVSCAIAVRAASTWRRSACASRSRI